VVSGGGGGVRVRPTNTKFSLFCIFFVCFRLDDERRTNERTDIRTLLADGTFDDQYDVWPGKVPPTSGQ